MVHFSLLSILTQICWIFVHVCDLQFLQEILPSFLSTAYFVLCFLIKAEKLPKIMALYSKQRAKKHKMVRNVGPYAKIW